MSDVYDDGYQDGLDKGRQEGYSDGYDKGFEQGLQANTYKDQELKYLEEARDLLLQWWRLQSKDALVLPTWEFTDHKELELMEKVEHYFKIHWRPTDTPGRTL